MSEDIDDALDRARQHGRAARDEAIEGLRVLLEVASDVSHASPGPGTALVDEIIRGIDAGLTRIGSGGGFELPSGIGLSLDRALGAEIARWEERVKSDELARPVLRVFGGMRELLWELGVPDSSSDQGTS